MWGASCQFIVFSKIFKQETGGTFVNYLTGRRMEEAKKLLLQTDYKSQVIGNMVGYPEPNYFSYVFKKIVECLR